MACAKFNRTWVLLAFIFATTGVAAAQTGLPAEEFSRLIQAFSEEGGYFPSDNFTSNEDSYLTIVDKMKELRATGGAYIGVGPEQNFTYIAKVRPRIAFIVDIRRQAVIQHLMYKALFQMSPTPAEFISRLLSRPMKGTAPGPKDPIEDIVSYFSAIKPDSRIYAENLAAIRKMIQDDFKFTLSSGDQDDLDYVYRNFRDQGFEIGFGMGGRLNSRFGHLPVLRELILQKDLKGKPGNFLADVDDYGFLRDMHRRNMIIPVVGDFGGKKALDRIGDYLRKKGYVVSVFYASNVEIVLFEWGTSSFPGFIENIRKLPTDDRSLLIRSTFRYYGHPQQRPGYALCTMLQKISVFLKDYDEGRYLDYRTMIRMNYIQ